MQRGKPARRGKTKAELLKRADEANDQDVAISGKASLTSVEGVGWNLHSSSSRTRAESYKEAGSSRISPLKPAKRSRNAEHSAPQPLGINEPAPAPQMGEDGSSASTTSIHTGLPPMASTSRTQAQQPNLSQQSVSAPASRNAVEMMYWPPAGATLHTRPPLHAGIDDTTVHAPHLSAFALHPRIGASTQHTDTHFPSSPPPPPPPPPSAAAAPILYRPHIPLGSNPVDAGTYQQALGAPFPSATTTAGQEGHPQTHTLQSSRRIWPQQSSDQSSLPTYPAPPPPPSHSQVATLSDQQRSHNFGLPAPSQHFDYASAAGEAAGNVNSGQYDNVMMNVGPYPNFGAGQGASNSFDQRGVQQQQQPPQTQSQQTSQYQQPQSAHHQAANTYGYQLGRHTDSVGLVNHPIERWQGGQRSDQAQINTPSGQSSTSSDWRSMPTLRMQQQLRGEHGGSFAGSSQSASSSEKAGKRHLSRARLQTHLRYLQAEMVDLKERVRVAEDLYRESSPVAGSSFSETTAGRLMNPAFNRMTSSEDHEMHEHRAGDRGLLSSGAEGSGMATMVEGTLNMTAGSSKGPLPPAGTRRTYPYGAPPSSSTSGSTTSVLGRRGTWRSGEDGKTLVFNTVGASAESGPGDRMGVRDEEEEQDEMKDASADMSATTTGGEEASKRYQCLVSGCLKTFTTSGHARRHSRTHLGHKLFVCPHDGCGSTFTRRDNCRQHQRARHQRTLPVYEMTESDTLEHLILDRQQEEQQRQFIQQQQQQQQQQSMYDPRAGPSSYQPR